MHKTSRTPQQAVYSIPELLEQILHFANLSPLALLRARLINRTANATILSVHVFRRVLFLDAAVTPAKSDHISTRDTKVDVEMNPLLEKMFPRSVQARFKRMRPRAEFEAAATLGYFNFGFETGEDKADASAAISSTVLPSLELAERCRGRDYQWACMGSSYAGPCLHLPMVGREVGEEHFRETREGIWRVMHASRPEVVIHAVKVGECGVVEHVCELGAGARMGDVMDVLVFGMGGNKGRVLDERCGFEGFGGGNIDVAMKIDGVTHHET